MKSKIPIAGLDILSAILFTCFSPSCASRTASLAFLFSFCLALSSSAASFFSKSACLASVSRIPSRFFSILVRLGSNTFSIKLKISSTLSSSSSCSSSTLFSTAGGNAFIGLTFAARDTSLKKVLALIFFFLTLNLPVFFLTFLNSSVNNSISSVGMVLLPILPAAILSLRRVLYVS